MSPQQAIQIIEGFRRVAIIPNANGVDHDTLRNAIQTISDLLNKPNQDSKDKET